MISPESQGGPNIGLITIVCGWTFVGIALLVVSLLIWCQVTWSRRIRPDDYLTILALVITIALVAQTTWAITNEGQDHHEADLSKAKFDMVVRSLLVDQTLWGVINTLIRTSAILFIERIFMDIKGMQRRTRSLLVLSLLYGVAVFLELFLICHPMAVDWNAHVGGTCANQVVSYLVLEVFGLLLDFTILVLPLPCIWTLRRTLAKKLRFIIVLSIGVLVFIITGLRIQALHMANAQDFTYSKGYLGLLSTLGASLGIIFCCIPAVPGAYRHWREASLKRASMAVHPDEENAAAASEAPDETSLPMAEDNPTQHRASMIVHINEEKSTIIEENGETALETRDQILLPMTKEDVTQTLGRNARWSIWSIERCDTHANPPPYGGLQRHRTF